MRFEYFFFCFKVNVTAYLQAKTTQRVRIYKQRGWRLKARQNSNQKSHEIYISWHMPYAVCFHMKAFMPRHKRLEIQNTPLWCSLN